MKKGQAEILRIDGKGLKLQHVIAVARSQEQVEVELSSEAKKTLQKTSEKVDEEVKRAIKEVNENRTKNIIGGLKELIGQLESKRANAGGEEQLQEKRAELETKQIELRRKMIYGVTTGFGELKGAYCKDEESAKALQKKIVLSHATGVGPIFDRETTRAIMLLRANTLSSGRCGIRPKVVEQLLNMLRADIRPEIPEQGSVGASGDLAPLSHLALSLIGVGPVRYGIENGEAKSLKQVKDIPAGIKIEPDIELTFKEGLALVNGITVTTGIGVLAYWYANNLVRWADRIGAITLESILGATRAFDKIVFTNYHHRGARVSAEVVRNMITGSRLINRCSDVHDPYSVRCIPQVHGAVRDALRYVRKTLQRQLNSVDDDPIFFDEEEIEQNLPMDVEQPPVGTAEDWKKRRHFEQGNFHGEPIAFAMDMLAIAVAELGNISERRTQMLLDKNHNRGLPPCLIDNPDGTNSGYMIAQYTAAALVSENKVLCHPASVDSVPTSANTEDHVSMGTIAARKARRVIENVRNILAIELLCSTEALSFRLGEQLVTDPSTVDLEEKERRMIKVAQTGECGGGTKSFYQLIRSKGIPLLQGEDAVLHSFIKDAAVMLKEPPPFDLSVDGKDAI